MTGYQWLAVMIGIAVALLLIWLLLIAALAVGRPKGDCWRQRTDGFHRAMPCPTATESCGEDCWFSRCSSSLTWSGWALAVPRAGWAGGRSHLHSKCDPRRTVAEHRSVISPRP